MTNKVDCPCKTENPTDEVDDNYKCRQTSLIVEFRPKQGFGGEFGFDWLRINDKGIKVQKNRGGFEEQPYEDAIITGHKSDKDRLTKEEAYTQLKEEYNPISEVDSKLLIKREGYEDSNYYVPYLNLFSKEASEKLEKEYSLTVAPPYFAELRLIFYASGICADQVIFEFPDEFEVTDTLNDDGTPAAGKKSGFEWEGNKDYMTCANNKASTIPFIVTCLKDISEEKYIKVFGVYEGEKFLAGKLCLLPNDKNNRKVLKIAQVPVKVRPDRLSKPIEGKVHIIELKRLHLGLYQALIVPEIITKNNEGHALQLDLTQDPLWQLPDDSTMPEIKEYLEKEAEYDRLIKELAANLPKPLANKTGIQLSSVSESEGETLEEVNKKRVDRIDELREELKLEPPEYYSYLELTLKGNEYYFNSRGKLLYRKGRVITRIDSNTGKEVVNISPKEVLLYLQDKFLQKYIDEYSDCFLMFVFDINARPDPNKKQKILGRVHRVGQRLGFLASRENHDVYVHELLHGLHLRHTHLETKPSDAKYNKENPNKNGQYIYHHAYYQTKALATDNFMSYGEPLNSSWKWQWDILHEGNK